MATTLRGCKISRNVLIIGSSGLIGSQLSKKLWLNGDKVIGNSRFPIQSNVIHSQLNCSYQALDSKILRSEEVDHIIFCAGDTTQFAQKSGYQINISIHLENFKKFIGIIKNIPTLQSVVFLSSAGALYESNQIVTENSPLKLGTDYAKLKFEMENVLVDASSESNFNSKILRISNVYGSTIDNQIRGGFINELIASSLANKVFSIDQNYKIIKKNFIYVDDLVNLILFFINLDSKSNILVNIANRESQTLETILLFCYEVFAKYDLKIDSRIVNYKHIGNLNHEFDLSLLHSYIPGYKNIVTRIALNEMINQYFKKQ